jgi:hypothetical protein
VAREGDEARTAPLRRLPRARPRLRQLGAQEASFLIKPGLASSARQAWEKAVVLDPANLDARADLVQFHLFAPGFMGGSADEARRQADEIAKRDPVQGAVARASIAQHDKDLAGA